MPQPPVFYAGRAELERDVVVLSGAEGHHAATVRRLRPGERADVSDGAGLVAECAVTARGSGGLELAVRARREVPLPDPVITVIQAIPKGDRGEAAVEGMTEVGVDRIVPWAAARCVPVWQGERGARSLARWRATAREAADAKSEIDGKRAGGDDFDGGLGAGIAEAHDAAVAVRW